MIVMMSVLCLYCGSFDVLGCFILMMMLVFFSVLVLMVVFVVVNLEFGRFDLMLVFGLMVILVFNVLNFFIVLGEMVMCGFDGLIFLVMVIFIGFLVVWDGVCINLSVIFVVFDIGFGIGLNVDILGSCCCWYV